MNTDMILKPFKYSRIYRWYRKRRAWKAYVRLCDYHDYWREDPYRYRGKGAGITEEEADIAIWRVKHWLCGWRFE